MRHLLTVFAIWLALTCCTIEAERAKMRNGLDGIHMRNRNDQPFTAGDVQPYVDFFDKHGTPNDQMLAYYLLGRAYHEHGEAPMALQCYQQAIEHADTTAKDCDYAQLSRVYGQMGMLYYRQNLLHRQLSATNKAIYYSLQAKDTFVAMSNYWQKSTAYEQLNDKQTAIAILDTLATWYKSHGQVQKYARALGRSLPILIEGSQWEKAMKYMKIYEEKSGLFDKKGNIESGREIYYYYKGIAYLNNNIYDSAEFWFRKELQNGTDFNNQNAASRGLALLYDKKGKLDSAFKYALFSYAMNDSAYVGSVNSVIEQMTSLYDYTRNQEIAKKKSEEAKVEKEKRHVIVALFLLFVVATTLFIFKVLRRERQGLEKYRQSLEELRHVRKEKTALSRYESEFSHILYEKDKRIDQLEKIVKKYGKHLYFSTANAELCLKESPSYSMIKKMAIKGEVLSLSDWETIDTLFAEYFPGFEDFLATYRAMLTGNKQQICQLLRLHFKPSDIAKMLDTSSANISQESSKILKNIFQKKGSSKDLAIELCKIF